MRITKIHSGGNEFGFHLTVKNAAGVHYYEGESELSERDLYTEVTKLQSLWNDRLVTYQGDNDSPDFYPFASVYDLSRCDRVADLDAAMRALARGGWELFRDIFLAYERTDDMRKLGEALRAALRSGEQKLIVISDDFFAPWGMMYLPPPGVNMADAGAPWEHTNFLGYGHYVEHSPAKPRRSPPVITVRGVLRAAINVDTGLDKQFRCHFVADMVRFFETTSHRDLREERDDLRAAMERDGLSEHLAYFGVHAHVDDFHVTEPPRLTLTDRENPISPLDLRRWHDDHPRDNGPLIFMNACRGGQMHSAFHKSFSGILLMLGARCLIGPHVDLPVAFAGEFARRFFIGVLAGEMVGDVMLRTVREFADEYRNPFGYTLTMHRGLDTYLDLETAGERGQEAR
ncbi:hypothetical protein [Actinoplanes utahensis]|uniref:CHAT domain-containing protein n=1 Tax=Actinoplanes utahensis TaxID=1869 RepID=A0A0A6UT74_ACTUT|nr:hypothetical protein [Actinoplanes utahensis]KHD78193.1 hypothetical protein MB27_07050 [Actinoplanes utahensis]